MSNWTVNVGGLGLAADDKAGSYGDRLKKIATDESAKIKFPSVSQRRHHEGQLAGALEQATATIGALLAAHPSEEKGRLPTSASVVIRGQANAEGIAMGAAVSIEVSLS